jgi:hypothetical protein
MAIMVDYCEKSLVNDDMFEAKIELLELADQFSLVQLKVDTLNEHFTNLK